MMRQCCYAARMTDSLSLTAEQIPPVTAAIRGATEAAITRQGDGSVIVATERQTVEITTAGDVIFEEES